MQMPVATRSVIAAPQRREFVASRKEERPRAASTIVHLGPGTRLSFLPLPPPPALAARLPTWILHRRHTKRRAAPRVQQRAHLSYKRSATPGGAKRWCGGHCWIMMILVARPSSRRKWSVAILACAVKPRFNERIWSRVVQSQPVVSQNSKDNPYRLRLLTQC